MNGPHTPSFLRDNRWTRLIERVASENAESGKPAGRMMEQLAMTGTRVIPAHRVRRMSDAEKRRTDFVPEPDDPRASMQANARAAALGISNDVIPQAGDDLPGDIGHVADEPDDAEIDRMLAVARGASVPGAEVAGEGAAAPGAMRAPQAAGRIALPHGASQAGLAGPRSMPNFANVEGFDLTRKVAVVDGMEFKLADEDVVNMKKFAIGVVLDNVTFQLAQALVALGIPEEIAKQTAETMRKTTAAAATPGGTSGTRDAGAGAGTAVEAVHKVQEGADTRSVSSGPTRKERVESPVPELRGDLQYLFGEESSKPEVPSHDQGSSRTPSVQLGNSGSSNDAASLLGDSGPTPS